METTLADLPWKAGWPPSTVKHSTFPPQKVRETSPLADPPWGGWRATKYCEKQHTPTARGVGNQSLQTHPGRPVREGEREERYREREKKERERERERERGERGRETDAKSTKMRPPGAWDNHREGPSKGQHGATVGPQRGTRRNRQTDSDNTHRQADRQTDKQTDRQTDRQTDKQTDMLWFFIGRLAPKITGKTGKPGKTNGKNRKK